MPRPNKKPSRDEPSEGAVSPIIADTLHSKIADIIGSHGTSSQVYDVEDTASAILKEVYEEVERSLPKKKNSWRSYSPNPSYQYSAKEGYNKAIYQFKSNLKLLMGGKDG